LIAAVSLLAILAATPSAAGSNKDKISYGEGLIVNIPFAEPDVVQVVADVTQNGVIRGTKEYNKDEFVSGAKATDSSTVFPPWTEGGMVFYKVRLQALDPRNFKDGGDVGTLAVRYVVQPQGEKNSVLRIDALYQEDFRHTIHQSNGSVETSEYKDIHERLEAIDVMRKQNIEAQQERADYLAKKQSQATGNPLAASGAPGAPQQFAPATESSSNPASREIAPAPADTPPPVESHPPQTLEERVKDLRKQVEWLVKSPGAPLKSAPFHTASTLQLLPQGTEVLILINTTYWYGVETHDGQHGWMQRDQLEQQP
jgi:polyhydroxyalkanoate synthesis regulator phasin